MVYVLDTNSFLELQSYYPETFLSFWESFNALVEDGRILSVSESLKEIEHQATADHLIEWVDENKHIFAVPCAEEMLAVAEIFKVKHFQQVIGAKQLSRGMPVADPFLVARGLHLGACVVTEEALKPHAAKIPNVCEHFGVECTNMQGLMARERWRF
jgi:hypothetical protein